MSSQTPALPRAVCHAPPSGVGIRLSTSEGGLRATPNAACTFYASQPEAQQGCTLRDFLASGDYSPATRDSYRRHLEAVAAAGYSALAITPSQFEDLARSRGWSRESLRARLYCLRAFCNWSGRPDAPIMRMKVRRQPLRPQRTVTLEEKQQLVQACRDSKSGRQLALVLELWWISGLRVSETTRVLLADVDLAAGTIGVRGKGGTWGQVALTALLCSLLEAWIREERRFVAKAPTLFVNTMTGEALTTEGLKALCHHLADKSGIPFSPHDLRRGMACHLTQKGVSLELVRRQGRWTNFVQLQRYLGALGIGDVRTAIEAVT